MNARIWFFLTVVIILAIVVIGSLIFSPSKTNQTPQGEIPVFNGSPRPSGITTQPSQISINKITPKEDLSIQNFPTAQIEIEFNQLINPATLTYSVSPTTKTFVKQGQGNVVIISPDPSWTKGITTITISEPVKLEYKIKTDIPETPPVGAGD